MSLSNFFPFKSFALHGLAKSIAIMVSSQGLVFAIQVGSQILLARLLTPDDFGLIAMTAVFVNFIMLFRDIGLGQATVQRENVTSEQVSTLHWINGYLSCAIALLIALSGPVIAWIYREPRLIWITVAISGPVALTGFNGQHQALIQRNLRFKRLALIQAGCAFCGACTGVIAAYLGMGVWSLVLMQYGQAIAHSIAVRMLSDWKPGKLRRGTGVRDMFSFGLNLTWFNLLNFFSRNLDNFLIGRFVGKAELGQYAMSYRLMMLPIVQLNAPLASVLTPSLCRAQNEKDQFETLFLSFIRGVAWLTMPFIAMGAVAGRYLIPLLLGTQWVQAAELFRWLALASFFQPVCSLSGSLFVARGRSDMLFRWGVVSSATTSLGFVVGLPHGVSGVAGAYACTCLLLATPNLYWSCRAGDIPFHKLARVLSFPIAASFLIFVGAHTIERFLS